MIAAHFIRGWKHAVEVERGDKHPNEVARALAEKLRPLPESFRLLEHGTTLDDLIDMLDAEAREDFASNEDVNAVLRELWDWADLHRLWVHIG
jgi:hypothetical protein